MNRINALCICIMFLTLPTNVIGQNNDDSHAYGEGYSIGWDENSIELTLDGSEIPKQITDKLITKFRETESVVIHFDETRSSISDKEIEWLAEITGITQITSDVTMGKRASISTLGYGKLSQLKDLETLEVKVTSFEGISKLAKLERFAELSLAHSRFSKSSDIRELEVLKNLEHLNLAMTNIDDRTVGSLQTMTWLRSLNLTGTEVSREGVAYLRQRLKTTNVESTPLTMLRENDSTGQKDVKKN